MALTQRLDLRQSQSLVMTPQLQQAIKLLQLSNAELADYVEGEIERNPLLEMDDSESAPAPAELVPGAEAPAADASSDLVGTDRLANAETLKSDADAPLDTDYENVWTSDGAKEAGDQPPSESGNLSDWGGPNRGGGFDGPSEFDLEQVLSDTLTLRDHLLQQVNAGLPDATDRLVGAYLVDLLDESGYMTAAPLSIAQQLGCDEETVARVLRQLQQCDPPGIFAADLSECLALQLADRNRLDPAMQALLNNLPLLAKRDFATLYRLCGVDRDDLSEMVAEIRALDPKPAQAFAHEVAQTVTPDILMRQQPGGGWLVELNADTLPKVLVNQRYFAEVNATVRDKADKDYLSECFASANWLVKSLHQRATTILKVATEIVRQQDRFFAQGVQYLRPLILRDIAERIDMHESTVSRVTSNKFIATPRGVFELKYFFTSAIQGANGEDAHSAESVRFRIRSLIEAEATDKILSDDRIVDILRSDGVDIARRTVAKYRESMRIPSSVQRRREKSMRL